MISRLVLYINLKPKLTQLFTFTHSRQVSIIPGYLRINLELLIFLPLIPKCWDYRCATMYSVYTVLGMELSTLSLASTLPTKLYVCKHRVTMSPTVPTAEFFPWELSIARYFSSSGQIHKYRETPLVMQEKQGQSWRAALKVDIVQASCKWLSHIFSNE